MFHKIQMAILLFSMYTAVCSATSDSLNIASTVFTKRLVNFLLNGMGIPLDLPTVVLLSLVRNFDEISQ